jgi:FkbM family methyltransferase
MSRFRQQFIQSILTTMNSCHDDNWDFLRFGPAPAVRHVAGANSMDLDHATCCFEDVLDHAADYGWIYETLADDQSRDLLVKLLAYRVLGFAHVKLPLNTERFWQEYHSIDERFLRQEKMARSIFFDLNQYAFPFSGTELLLVVDPLTILMQIVGQYYFDRNGVQIGPSPGDVVIDGGGCWSEVALVFASSVGPTGKVYSFEFVPENLAIGRTNLEANPSVADRVEIVEKALYERSNLRLPFNPYGPGSRLIGGASDENAETVSIDDFVAARGLNHVDVIKLDIEGSEITALRGARATIARFKPKLAISVYHKPHDLFEIPRLIRGYEPGYEFYLDHYTIHLEETVLYGRVC